jgi:hypothetical protein
MLPTFVQRILEGAVRGAAAGAAGTAALDALTYADMALRGRPASTTPERSVEIIAEQFGISVPGEGETRQNRLTGLGALSGTATGVTLGAALGAVRAMGVRLPLRVATPVVGAAVMAATNLPMMRLGVSDPRDWSAADWLSDIVPHLAYAAVTCATLEALVRRTE